MKLEELANRLDELIYKKGMKFEIPINGEHYTAKVIKDRDSAIDIEINKGLGFGKEIKQISKESFVNILKHGKREKGK